MACLPPIMGWFENTHEKRQRERKEEGRRDEVGKERKKMKDM